MDLENDCGGRVGPVFDSVSEDNIHKLIGFINKHHVPLTLFVAGQLFEEKRKELNLIRQKIEETEFALHSYSHPNLLDDYSQEIDMAVWAYQDFMGKAPLGYRAPQGKISLNDLAHLKKHRFQYDSSIIPTIRPGVFNNRKMPKEPFFLSDYHLVEIPCSVFPLLPIPMGLGFLRLFGESLTKILFTCLPLPRVLVFVFHLHDILPTEHVEKLKGFWKFYYQRNIDRGFPLLDFVIGNLKNKGYRFDLMKNCPMNPL